MKRSTITKTTTMVLSSLLLFGCGVRVKSYPYDETLSGGGEFGSKKEYKDKVATGFTYSLSKTVFDMKATCSLYRRIFYTTVDAEKIQSVLYIVNMDEGVSVVPRGVADPALRFRVDARALKDWRVLTEKANFKMADNGVLTDMNASFDDRTAEIIESTTKAGINVAKTIALAGAAANKTEGVLEKIGTFEVSAKYDPDTCPLAGHTRAIFEGLPLKAQAEVSANLEKDALKGEVPLDKISIIVNQISLRVDPITLQRPTSINLSNSLAKDNFGNSVIRLVTLENFQRNYMNGLVTRIPGYINIHILSEPVVVRDGHGFKTLLANRLGRITAAQNAIIQVKLHPTTPDADQKQIDDLNEQIEDLTSSLTPQTLFEGHVPVSQFGKLAIIPMRSNTFVKQGKTIVVNKDTGAINSFDMSATSSGERAALMLEHISESVLKELPELISTLNSSKAKKNAE